jgi:hypothetical protein
MMQVEIKTTRAQQDTGLLQKAADYTHAFILGVAPTSRFWLHSRCQYLSYGYDAQFSMEPPLLLYVTFSASLPHAACKVEQALGVAGVVYA